MAEAKKKTTTKAKTVTAEKAAKKTVTKKVTKVEEAPAEVVLETPTTEAKPIAKAGKRSAKAVEEKAEKVAKEARKTAKTEEDLELAAKPKQHKNPTRSKLERQSKKMREAAKLIEADKLYVIKEALELAIKTATVKFDSTVELHINLGVDPRQADQNVRDSLVLPAGTGRTIRVAVFAEADDAAAAKKAGADIVGEEEITNKLDKGVVEFDTLIATPTQMAKLGKYARVLGPKGLMPNPKSGTVTTDVAKAVKEAKAGRVEYRVDSTGIVHLGIGKVSFGAAKLLENADAVLASIKSNKPSSTKSTYLKSAFVTTTMGPSIKLDSTSL